MSFLTLQDLELTDATRVKQSKRYQRATFGDGYSQIMGDGLNSEKEVWSCETKPLSLFDYYSVEAFLRRNADTAMSWSPPDATKSFQAAFSNGSLTLGYTNLSALTLESYTRPTNYTANLVSGVLTSVTIPNNTAVVVTLTESAKQYLLRDGWERNYVSPELATLSFELERFYG